MKPPPTINYHPQNLHLPANREDFKELGLSTTILDEYEKARVENPKCAFCGAKATLFGYFVVATPATSAASAACGPWSYANDITLTDIVIIILLEADR